MKIGIIGAGNLGCSLAIGLKGKGYYISGIYSKSAESSKALNIQLGEAFKNSLEKTVQNSDTLFLTVPDTEIEKTADIIAQSFDNNYISGKCFFHCSGALTSDVLHAIKAKGGFTGSIHPIQTFADRNNGWKGLSNIYFGYEGCSEAQRLAERIIRDFNGKIITVSKENKPIYHAAACILSNYLVTLSNTAVKLLDSIGINEDHGIKAFSPLIDKTIENIKGLGTVKALTGPISRGDTEVVEGHINTMEQKCPEELKVYKTLGEKTIDLALEKGTIDFEQAKQLKLIIEN